MQQLYCLIASQAFHFYGNYSLFNYLTTYLTAMLQPLEAYASMMQVKL
jgi:hypothetical protein